MCRPLGGLRSVIDRAQDGRTVAYILGLVFAQFICWTSEMWATGVLGECAWSED